MNILSIVIDIIVILLLRGDIPRAFARVRKLAVVPLARRVGRRGNSRRSY